MDSHTLNNLDITHLHVKKDSTGRVENTNVEDGKGKKLPLSK